MTTVIRREISVRRPECADARSGFAVLRNIPSASRPPALFSIAAQSSPEIRICYADHGNCFQNAKTQLFQKECVRMENPHFNLFPIRLPCSVLSLSKGKDWKGKID
jgi:hypothetical protein